MSIIYKCERCKKKFSLKGDYERHLTRKFKCKIDSHINDKIDLYICDKCSAGFTRKDCLAKHSCAPPEFIEDIHKETGTLLSQDKSKNITIIEGDKTTTINTKEINMENPTGNTMTNMANPTITNPTITNTITNTIKADIIKFINKPQKEYDLVPFGKEHIDVLTINEIGQIINSDDPISVIFEKMYINPNNINNHNLYYSDTRSKIVKVFTGKKWNDLTLRTVQIKLHENCIKFLEYIYNMFKDAFHDHEKMNKFKGRLDDIYKSKSNEDKYKNNKNSIYQVFSDRLTNNKKLGQEAWVTTKERYKSTYTPDPEEDFTHVFEDIKQDVNDIKAKMGQLQDCRDESIAILKELLTKGKVDKKFDDDLVMLIDKTFNIDHFKIIIKLLNDRKNHSKEISLDIIKNEIAKLDAI